MTSSGDADAAATRPEQRERHFDRWRIVHMALLAANIVAALAGAHIVQRLDSALQRTADAASAWSERMIAYTDLEAALDAIDAPGNDIFRSRDVTLERARLARATEQFGRATANALETANKLARIGEHSMLLRDLQGLIAAGQAMQQECARVIELFESKNLPAATESMAVLDAMRAKLRSQVTRSLLESERALASYARSSNEQARNLRVTGFVLVALAVGVMIGGLWHVRRLTRLAQNARTARDEAHRALQESEQLLLRLADHAPVGLFRADAQGRLTFVNRKWRTLTGQSLESAGNQPWTSGVHPEDLERVAAEWRRATLESRGFELTYRLRDALGKTAWVIGSSNAVLDAHGEVVAYLGALTDISNEKSTETDLNRASQLHAAILDGASYAVIAISADGVVRTFNKGAEQMLGYNADEIVNKASPDIFCSPVDLQRLIDQARKQSAPGSTAGRTDIHPRTFAEEECVYITKNATPISVLVALSVMYGAEGDVAGYVAIASDVSERKRILMQLRQSKAQMSNIIANAMDAIIAVNTEQRIVIYNRAAAAMFGHSVDKVIGRPLSFLMPQRFREGHTAHLQKFGESRTSSRVMGSLGAVVGLRANGEEFPIEASISHTMTGAEKLYTVILRDITVRQKAEEQLKAALKMQSEFVSFASHQLRTPLAGIKWALELAAQEEELSEDARSFIDDGRQAAGRLIQLVNDLLNVSRLERGRLDLSPQTTDLARLTQEVVDELQVLAKNKGHAMRFEADRNLPAAWIDPQMIRQVVLNYLSNAIKYTPDGGQIDARLSLRDGMLCWAVRDNGVGVPDVDHEKLFGKFHRAENVRTLDTEGTGLGLYMVRLIVEQSGGEAWFESQEGQGSTFYFTVPIQQEDALRVAS